jgi:hypothetical protein
MMLRIKKIGSALVSRFTDPLLCAVRDGYVIITKRSFIIIVFTFCFAEYKDIETVVIPR